MGLDPGCNEGLVGEDGSTYKIRASLFLKSRKRPVWMPKTTSEVARAVRKATKLMPEAYWAVPVPPSTLVMAAGALLVVVDILT